jgi:hypothetical protein
MVFDEGVALTNPAERVARISLLLRIASGVGVALSIVHLLIVAAILALPLGSTPGDNIIRAGLDKMLPLLESETKLVLLDLALGLAIFVPALFLYKRSRVIKSFLEVMLVLIVMANGFKMVSLVLSAFQLPQLGQSLYRQVGLCASIVWLSVYVYSLVGLNGKDVRQHFTKRHMTT